MLALGAICGQVVTQAADSGVRQFAQVNLTGSLFYRNEFRVPILLSH